MSGRIRTVKPEMLEDERVADLSLVSFKLFIGCILAADDYGALRGVPAALAGRVFWRETERGTVDVVDVAEALMELVSVGLLLPFKVRGQKYVTIKNWNKHQRVDKPGKPLCPQTSEREYMSVLAFMAEIREPFANASALTRESFAPDLDLDQRPTTNEETPGSPPLASNQLPLLPPGDVAGLGRPASPFESHQTRPSGTSGPANGAPQLVLVTSEPNGPTDVEVVWDAYLAGWRRLFGAKGRPPRFDDKRKALVRRRLPEHGLDQLVAAVSGVWLSEFHVNGGHTSIDLVLRDAAHVEQFAGIHARLAPKKPAPADPNRQAREEAALAALERERLARLGISASESS